MKHLPIFVAMLGLLMSGCRESQSFYSNVMRSDVFVQQYDDSKYDFLWVFDNSGSMKDRRDFVKDNLQGFLSILNSRKAIDYQMAATTTDVFSHEGNLVASPTSGIDVVKSASTPNAAAEFASIINAVSDSPTSFWEQGLEASYQAIVKHRSKFVRAGVPLIVVYLTDENDYSCKDDCFGVEPENNLDWKQWGMERYTDYFRSVKLQENSDVAVFPIVGLDMDRCSVASAGQRYMDLATSMGSFGTSASICNSDLRDSYNGIAKVIADRGNVFVLSSRSSGKGISVYVDDTLIANSPDNYVFDEEKNSIVFTGYAPKKGSRVEVSYAELVH